MEVRVMILELLKEYLYLQGRKLGTVLIQRIKRRVRKVISLEDSTGHGEMRGGPVGWHYSRRDLNIGNLFAAEWKEGIGCAQVCMKWSCGRLSQKRLWDQTMCSKGFVCVYVHSQWVSSWEERSGIVKTADQRFCPWKRKEWSYESLLDQRWGRFWRVNSPPTRKPWSAKSIAAASTAYSAQIAKSAWSVHWPQTMHIACIKQWQHIECASKKANE